MNKKEKLEIVQSVTEEIDEETKLAEERAFKNSVKQVLKAIQDRKQVIGFFEQQISEFAKVLKDIANNDIPINPRFASAAIAFKIGGVDYEITADGIKPIIKGFDTTSAYGMTVSMDYFPMYDRGPSPEVNAEEDADGVIAICISRL